MSKVNFSNGYDEFSLGSFEHLRAAYGKLTHHFPGRYSMNRLKEVDNFELWIMSDEFDDETESAVFLVRGREAIVVGQDALAFMNRVFEGVL